MPLHIAQLPRLLKERRSSAIFGVAIIAMLWCGISLKYYEDYRGDLRDAERSGKNFAMAFEENVLRSLGEIDMRVIAPTLAAVLGVKLEGAEMPPLSIKGK